MVIIEQRLISKSVADHSLEPENEVGGGTEPPGRKGNATVLLNLKDLEQRSGISRHTWRSWVRARKVPSVRLGGRRVLVDEKDYLAYVDRCRVPATQAGGK